MSPNNLCFGAKIRKIGISLHTPICYIKVGFKGYTLHGRVFLMSMEIINSQAHMFCNVPCLMTDKLT